MLTLLEGGPAAGLGDMRAASDHDVCSSVHLFVNTAMCATTKKMHIGSNSTNVLAEGW